MNNVIWVDENDTILGIVPREKAHAEGLLHRIAVVYITNEKRQILVQERLSGRLDHSVGGHVDPRETYEQAAYRELYEELGIQYTNLTTITTGNALDIVNRSGKIEKINHKYLIFTYQGSPQKINAKEVKAIYWYNPYEIFEDMKQSPGNDKYTNCFKDSLQKYLQNSK